MKHAKNRSLTLTSALALAALVACDGRSRVGEAGSDAQPTLLSVETGRLVDVYAFRRVDPNVGDRRQRTNRRLELVAENVMINGNIEGQSLFDAAGQAVATANFEFLPFDKAIGHEELVILWDDRPGPEEQNFKLAFTVAQAGLGQVPPSYRGQNTQTRPIPIVPRNAAIKLTFSGKVDADPAFFAANPSVIQVLEFKGDPELVEPADAFRILPYRIIATGNTIILDTTILGGEAAGAATTPGLPQSSDNQTANIRIAIPSRGEAVSTFYVKEDPIAELNGIDSAGRASVIRDFRSGNLADGAAGRMREPEAPMIVSPLAMGITAVDVTNNLITLNKRLQFVPVRGRYPFVDGPLGVDGIPRGPNAAPVQRPLKFGDILLQSIQVEAQPGQFETVTLRAEVLENLSIYSTVGDPAIGLVDPSAGPLPPAGNDSGQGETVPVVQVRVASVFAGKDSTGTLHRFRANALPLGQDCTLRARYYEENLFTGSTAVLSDRNWRNFFVRIDPKPPASASLLPVTDVQPNASVAVEFTKPMDLDQVDPTFNLLLTSLPSATETFAQQMTEPKVATARIVTTRLSDLNGDGTVLRLQPPIGLHHRQNTAELYRVNVRLGTAGVTDLAGTALEVFQNPASPLDAWTVDFSLALNALDNLVAWHTYCFTAEDEDGTLEGSVDFFGQYRLENGRLTAASTVRFGRSADQQSLAPISRITRGECWDGRQQIPGTPPPTPPPPIANPAPNVLILPAAPLDQNLVPHTGNLYWDPQMTATVFPPAVPQVYEFYQLVPQPVGRVIEPMKPQGSRMQMRYIEDDFTLSYRQPSEFALDVEQIFWSPFGDEQVLFDIFDRFTMSLGHAKRRPDEFWFLDYSVEPPVCTLACASMNSSLSTVFADNVLDGTSLVPVFEDKVYAINPNEAFRTTENTKFVPFPRFDRTYTWRDSRLVTIDAAGNVIGLGGAQDPRAAGTSADFTAKIDSPWIESQPLEWQYPGTPLPGGNPPDPEFFGLGNTVYVEDAADFRGEAQRDHDPIALPLLVDFKMFADDQANGLAIGGNGFQVAMLGPPSYGTSPYGGYYDSVPSGCAPSQPRWPRTRVHASGGFDLVTLQPILVDPANVLSTTGSIVKDAGSLTFNPNSAATALFQAPPGDGMLNWARADFVRKVSTVTFGFFDTQRPQLTAFPAVSNGFPDLSFNTNLRINDLVVQMDPPQQRQPAGTSVVVEVRGANEFGTPATLVLYDPVTNDKYNERGNLLNANYACEAYRYSTPNFSPTFDIPRVTANGLTRYVTEDQLGQIRNPATGLLPRYLNVRVVMTNNVDVSPALSPSLRSLGIVYRMQAAQ